MTVDTVLDAEIVEPLVVTTVVAERLQRAEVGDRVRIDRDETRYPSKGTWPQFRGRVGTVVEVNTDRKRPHLTEYGVVFGKARTDRCGGQSSVVTWFKAHEMCAPASQRQSEGLTAAAS